jgi:hypothetical protein
MIKKLPFILLLMLASGLASQNTQTITIDWSFNSIPSASGNAKSSRTIEVGDTVTWNWYSGGSHNVKSNPNSNESFESQFFTQGGTFSKTFTSVGTNDYVCTPHASIMFGTITVVAEGVLSISDANRLDFEMYPNPASERITIQLPSGSDNATVQFYDYIGRLALTKNITTSNNKIDVNILSTGVYILKVMSEDKIGSQKFIKK